MPEPSSRATGPEAAKSSPDLRRMLRLFRAGLLAASLPGVLAMLALAAVLRNPAPLVPAALFLLVPQFLAWPALRSGSPTLLILLLRASYHSLRLLSRSGELAPETMVVAVSNERLGRAGFPRIEGGRVLLLLPHCLQQHCCPHRIVFDATRCERCGACDMGGLLDLAEEEGVRMAIATGGTSARKAVMEACPSFIIAVACPRDLCSGILDTGGIPVWGELNSRPAGDCMDTRVDVGAVRRVLGMLRP